MSENQKKLFDCKNCPDDDKCTADKKMVCSQHRRVLDVVDEFKGVERLYFLLRCVALEVALHSSPNPLIEMAVIGKLIIEIKLARATIDGAIDEEKKYDLDDEPPTSGDSIN